MSLDCIQDYVSLLKDIITTSAAFTAAILGILGLSTWRKQLKGRTEYELARRLLTAAYQLRNSIAYFRNPFMSAGEISQAMEREGMEVEITHRNFSYQSTVAVYKTRWEKISNAMTDLEVETVEAEVLWGSAISGHIQNLTRLVSDLNLNVGNYLRELSRPGRDRPDEIERYERFVYARADPDEDEFAARLSTGIDAIEQGLRPYLTI